MHTYKYIYIHVYIWFIWIYVPTCRRKCNWCTLKYLVLVRIKGFKNHPKYPEIHSLTRGGRQTKDCSKTWSFSLQFRLGKHFSDEHWLPFYYLYNWVFWTFPNIWRDTVSKWTHRLLKAGNNLKRSLYCACGGCYPGLSGGGSELIKKVPMMERLPMRFNIVAHR